MTAEFIENFFAEHSRPTNKRSTFNRHTMSTSPRNEIVINHHRPSKNFMNSCTHVSTRIGMMSSEERPPRTNAKSNQSTSPSVRSSCSNSEDDESWTNTIICFVKSYHGTLAWLMFWLFLPITLPFLIFKAFVHDFMKIRQIFVLTLECMIMQLQLVFEMMSCIQHSNSSIDEKVEKMGRAFHFLNVFNPIHWIGMLLYYVHHNVHHTSPAKASLVDQENQTNDDDQITSRSKQQTKGKNSGMIPIHKKTHLTVKDEIYASSDDDEEGRNKATSRIKGEKHYNADGSEHSGSTTSESGKRVEFKSCDEESVNANSSIANDGSSSPEIDDVGDESF